MLGLSERERALAKDDELTRMLDDAGKPPRDPAKKIGWRQWYTTMYRTPYDPAARSAFYYNPEDPAAWIADLYAFPNWSLLSHYINIGIALAFISTPVVTYLVETANASAAQVNTYSAVTYLPWCLKIFFGLQSDLVPLFGIAIPLKKEVRKCKRRLKPFQQKLSAMGTVKTNLKAHESQHEVMEAHAAATDDLAA